MESCLYQGQVMHHRRRPFGHRFSYRVTSLLLDLESLSDLHRRFRWLSWNRFNLLSVRAADLAGGSAHPRDWLNEQLARFGIMGADGRIFVHVFPRVLGIGFSPLTTWFCEDSRGHLRAVLYEVHNTFGERHCYLAETDPTLSPQSTHRHRADKIFHVSPFLDQNGLYRFAIKAPEQQFAVVIRAVDPVSQDTLLVASHLAVRQPLTDGAMVRGVLRFLWLPIAILGGIHWQAFKLWCRGARFHRKPVPPAELISAALPLQE